MPRAMAKKENHMGFMSKLLSFGSDKDLKRYYKIVDQINGLEPQFEKMTEEELRAQTDKFRERYANGRHAPRGLCHRARSFQAHHGHASL